MNGPAITASAIKCGYVQAAQRRMQGLRTAMFERVEEPTAIELEEALGESVQKCELWKQNWRNRIYRVELADRAALVAKQALVGTEATTRCQFDQLRVLADLQIPRMRVPKGLAILPTKRIFVMEFQRGETIEDLLWGRRDELLTACNLAGTILAQIHLAWSHDVVSMPVDAIACDLAASPWRLSSRERTILESVLERLVGTRVNFGTVYYDYKAANHLFDDGDLRLIDPPDTIRQGVQLWDFSRFRSSMRRHLWNCTLRRPFIRWRPIVIRALAAFERGYCENCSGSNPESNLFAMAVRLFELQRTAVLMSMQEAKLSMAREKVPIMRDHSLRNDLRERMTMRLLEIEKRWLFRQLAHELPM